MDPSGKPNTAVETFANRLRVAAQTEPDPETSASLLAAAEKVIESHQRMEQAYGELQRANVYHEAQFRKFKESLRKKSLPWPISAAVLLIFFVFLIYVAVKDAP